MKTAFLIISILLANSSFAQKNDYLVKHNGDTLIGKIELRNKIFELTSSSGEITRWNATDIKKVHSEEIRFNTVVPCVLHTYVDMLTELQYFSYANRDIDTVMILNEVYTTPKMNLYWGVDNFRQQYYFYKTPADSLPIQLYINYSLGNGLAGNVGDQVQKGNYGSSHIVVQKGYVNQLRLIMGDCKKISDEEWNMLDYRVYSLKAVIKRYNKCK
jgi:hypothetical protein